MRKSLTLSIVFCVCNAVASIGQPSRSNTVSQGPASDPFRIVSGTQFSAAPANSRPRDSNDIDVAAKSRITADFEDALDIVRYVYVDSEKVPTPELAGSAIREMLRTLDPHSRYFDAADYRQLLEEQNSEYSGIGSTIINYNHDGQIATYIVATSPDGPAARAGLRYGDRIVAVDGEPMQGKTADVVRDKVRGANGSMVSLTIERAANLETNDLELRRGRLVQESIPDAYIFRSGVGYIDLTTGFNFSTSGEFNSALQRLKLQGLKTLIIDLRGNPGGVLDQAVKVAETFLPAGAIVLSQQGRTSSDNRVWRSANRNPETFPIVLLVDGNSASAAEILAGALQDHDRALIVGEKTFGKGLVQNVVDLPFAAGLTITTARYFTPSGRSIQRDYSSGSYYDYYNHQESPITSNVERSRAQTAGKRVVFGGDGIMPDEVVESSRLSMIQESLIDPLFHFSIRLRNAPSNAQSPAIRYRENGRSSQIQRLSAAELTDKFAAFAEDASGDRANIIKSNESFIRTRLEYNFMMAKSGANAAARVLLPDDPQMAAALKVLPKAAAMARSNIARRFPK